ncbi:MAG: hypothetical protein AAFY56_07105, partial [Pseudomonadota bacterium]
MASNLDALNGSMTDASLGGILRRAMGQTDILLAIGIITILAVLILPLPRILLDLSLALSITFSVLVLLTALFID